LKTFSVITCAHNEEKYIERSLQSVFNQAIKPRQVIVVLDRCTDKTSDIVRSYPVDFVVRKDEKKWKNSYAESLEIGRRHVESDYVAIADADIVLPVNYFEEIMRNLDETVVCISGRAVTTFPSMLGRILKFKEQYYDRFVHLGEATRGCCMVIKADFLDSINGFKDVIAPDTYVTQAAKESGLQTRLLSETTVCHIRQPTVGKVIANQLNSGKARRRQRISFWRTLLHSIFRLRPFVLLGYISG